MISYGMLFEDKHLSVCDREEQAACDFENLDTQKVSQCSYKAVASQRPSCDGSANGNHGLAPPHRQTADHY